MELRHSAEEKYNFGKLIIVPFSPAFLLAMLQNNWFILLAVRTSSYGCTWEVWRALKTYSCTRLRLEQLLRFSRALQTSRVHP